MQYYYLMSSLPDLSPEEPVLFEIGKLVRQIEENLVPLDLKYFRYLLYRNDNKNIMHHLRLTQGLRDASHLIFYEPAAYAFEELEDHLKEGEKLPAYMQDFLAAFHRDELPTDWRLRENILKEKYYQEALSLGEPFLKAYFTFKRNLKNILSALNARQYGFPLADVLIGEDDLTVQLQSATQSDFGLGREFPFIDDLRQYIEEKAFVKLEQTVDRLLLVAVQDLAHDRFSRAAVFAYFIEASLMQRWVHLEEKAGLQELENMIHRIVTEASWPEHWHQEGAA
ncbi:MAG: DUF2764 family protein [Spirochaetales bacterium]|nr:DUF2764 family protein [Spirochaetales bacterium]